MQLSDRYRPMWSAYARDLGAGADERFFEVFAFGDSPELADELAQLVLAGTKRATAAAVWAIQAAGKRLPRAGDLSMVTDGAGNALCIIETTAVELMPFDAVSAEFAAIEGEGDGSLRYWREVHVEYFTRECERAGRSFDGTMLVCCEKFRVVHPPEARSAD